MKSIFICIALLLMTFADVQAQPSPAKKRPTIGLHFFYNDFATPSIIQANGFGHIIKNNQWTKPNSMQGGFGLDFMQGLTRKIDAVATINTSWVDYASTYGTSSFLFDINVGAHIKLLTDKHLFDPFLVAKIGYSTYRGINGFTLMPGAGIQINLFDEAFILTTVEYRQAISPALTNQLYYSVGIATHLFTKKKKADKLPTVEAPAPTTAKTETPVADTTVAIMEEPKKIPAKNVLVSVTDEATGQPLPLVEITLKSNSGTAIMAISNSEGKVVFNDVAAGNYLIGGKLNRIEATTANVHEHDFSGTESQLTFAITHNDPRFTLVGNTVDKTANRAVGNTNVTITNITQGSTAFATSNATDGKFRTQLEGASDFTIVGKKANFMSNIENVSTKGLNRSVTLYVKLQLGIEEVKTGKNIVLDNIYFQTGKSDISAKSSSDLDKLLQFLKDNPATRLEIQGHTDNVGSLASNIKLSQARANSIVLYLLRNGIEKTRLQAKGYGPQVPISNNTTAVGRSRNRRVEMMVMD